MKNRGVQSSEVKKKKKKKKIEGKEKVMRK